MTQQVPATVAPSRIECQRCQASNESDSRFCKMCGASTSARPVAPVLTHVLEETESRMKIVDVGNGQKSAQVEYKTHTWMLGGAVPDDDKTEIRAMFKTPDGTVRIHVRPKPGSTGAQHNVAYLIEVPPKNVRFTMKTLPVAIQDNEIALDEMEYGSQEEEPEEPEEPTEPEPQIEAAAPNGSPTAGTPILAGQG